MKKNILMMCSVAVSALSLMTAPTAFADNTLQPTDGSNTLVLASIDTRHAGGLANLAAINPAPGPGTFVATRSADQYLIASKPVNNGKQAVSTYVLTNKTAPQDELPILALPGSGGGTSGLVAYNEPIALPSDWVLTSTETVGSHSGYSITAYSGNPGGGADVLADSRPDVGYAGEKFSILGTKELSYSTGTSDFSVIIANSGDSLGGVPLLARTGSDVRYFNKVANTRERIANKFSVTFAQSGKAFGSANLLASNTLNAPFNTVAVTGSFESGSRCGHDSVAGGGLIPDQGFT